MWHGEKQHNNFVSSVNMSLNVPMPCRHARPVVSRHHHDYMLDTTTITDGPKTATLARACTISLTGSLALFFLPAQLRKERSLGEETAQRLSEKETAVRELTKRLREAEKAAAAATAATKAAIVGTRIPPGAREVI